MTKIKSSNITQEQLDSVAGYSSRDAAKILNVGKTTVTNARALARANHGKVLPVQTPNKEGKPARNEEGYTEERNGKTGVFGATVFGEQPITYDEILRKFGRDPEAVKIVGTLSEGHWGSDEQGWRHTYKFRTEYVLPEDEISDIDGLAVLKELRECGTGSLEGYVGGPGAFVLCLNDTQFGKSEGGGTQGTLERVYGYIAKAKLRIEELRSIGRDLGTLVVIGGGDIIENCNIFPNQSYHIDMTRRNQIKTSVGTILTLLDTLAPMFEKVVCLVSRGNHGENRINGHKTDAQDNDDCLVFEIAWTATERDTRLQHVKYIIAEDEAGVYTDVAGWRLATTHGDIYAKFVGGATIAKKAQNWFKNMAAGRDPLGLADVLITHHYHHDEMVDWGATLWRQTPAQDGGSEYFRQSSGEYSKPGMLTFVMTPEDRYRDELVLR
jgi:hypothetical protein